MGTLTNGFTRSRHLWTNEQSFEKLFGQISRQRKADEVGEMSLMRKPSIIWYFRQEELGTPD